MTKYYIGQIDERNGEYEYSTTIRFKTNKHPGDHLAKIASTWYGDHDEDNVSDSGWCFNCGEIWTYVGDYQEVTKPIYETLTLLNEL